LARLSGSITSQDLVKSVNCGIHKCVDLGKEAAADLARRIQKEIDKAQSKSGK